MTIKMTISEVKNMLKGVPTCKYKTGEVIEVPPEGSILFIEVLVPAKKVVEKDYLRDDNGDFYPAYRETLVPDFDHPHFEEIVRVQVEERKRRNELDWEEFQKNKGPEPVSDNAEEAYLKAMGFLK